MTTQALTWTTGDILTAVGIGVALVTSIVSGSVGIGFALRADRRSKAANEIARRALALQEEATHVKLQLRLKHYSLRESSEELACEIRNIGQVEAHITQVALESDLGDGPITTGLFTGDIDLTPRE